MENSTGFIAIIIGILVAIILIIVVFLYTMYKMYNQDKKVETRLKNLEYQTSYLQDVVKQVKNTSQ